MPEEQELRSKPMKCKVNMELEFEALTTEEVEWQLKALFDTLRTGGYKLTTDTCTFVANGTRFTYGELGLTQDTIGQHR